MAEQQFDYGSPRWWLQRLAKRLERRASTLKTYDDYYSGNHPLLFATSPFRKTFGDQFANFADNWCDLVVDAVAERMTPWGIRMGADEPADTDAWDMWQRSGMDAQSKVLLTESLINAEASALVWWGEDGEPEITIEHPREMVVECASANRRQRLAALKWWRDDEGYQRATVYLPEAIWKFRAVQPDRGADLDPQAESPDFARITWANYQPAGDPAWPLPNRLGKVPVVPFYNKPRLLTYGVSEIHKVIPLQNAVNKLMIDMLVASEFAGFRQRYITGVEIPVDPETNEPVADWEEKWKSAVDRLWMFDWDPGDPENPNPEPKLGEFGATDLNNYTNAVEMAVQHIASQTRTPPHYFYLSGQFPSGESIKAAETGLVAKALNKMGPYAEDFEEVFRLAFAVKGDTARAAIQNSEIIWKDPESRTEGEHVDAVLKMKALGIPDEALWEKLGLTPQEIERYKAMRAEEALQTAVAFDPFAAVPAGPPQLNGNGAGAPAGAQQGA